MPDRRPKLREIERSLHDQLAALRAVSVPGDRALFGAVRLLHDAIDLVDVAALACAEPVPA